MTPMHFGTPGKDFIIELLEILGPRWECPLWVYREQPNMAVQRMEVVVWGLRTIDRESGKLIEASEGGI